jgi:hypothetical protein
MEKQIIISYREYKELERKQTIEEWAGQFIMGQPLTVGQPPHERISIITVMGAEFEIKTTITRRS